MNSWVGEIVTVVPGQRIHCRGVIPVDLEVFLDHFPDFPVLPGVLALDILRESIDCCLENSSPQEKGAQRLQSVRAVKFQHFLRPGELWESHASYSQGQPLGLWNVKLMVDSRIAVSARMLF